MHRDYELDLTTPLNKMVNTQVKSQFRIGRPLQNASYFKRAEKSPRMFRSKTLPKEPEHNPESPKPTTRRLIL